MTTLDNTTRFAVEIHERLNHTPKRCRVCGQDFIDHTRWGTQLTCPTCLDRQQNRPTVVRERLCLSERVVRIDSLPAEWQPNATFRRDFPSWKIDVRGRDLPRGGKAYEGRIVIHAPHPYQSGAVVVMREMVAAHVDARGNTLEYTYVALDPAPEGAQPAGKLLFVRWAWKTTLKGLGRQWHEHVRFSDTPLWMQEISSSVRSGRLGERGALVVLPLDADYVVERDER